MVTFALRINSRPNTSHARHALRFARAAQRSGYAVACVFFQGDGVFHADEPSWREWATLGMDCVACSASAEEYGLWRAGQPLALGPGFRFGGLAQWVEACLKVDRVLCFG